jgi:hypothetical protein
MPKRPHSHRVADQAVNRVESIFVNCGWACDRIQHDYGEDLFVQTALNDEVDPHRIFVQVKGTTDIQRFRNKRLAYSLGVPKRLALRWARSAELVVIVLWDVGRDRGVWASSLEFPPEQDWQLVRGRSVRIKFRNNSPFNETQVRKLGWLARVWHLEKILQQAPAGGITNGDGKRIAGRDSFYETTAKWIALDFLRQISVVEETPKVRRMRLADWFIRECKQMSKSRKASSDPVEVGTLVTMRKFRDVTGGVGLPHHLLVSTIQAITAIVDLYSSKLQKLK